MSELLREWWSLAACKDVDPDSLYVDGAEQHVAKRICTRCEVKPECLAEALRMNDDYGVQGGMTSRERRVLRRRYEALGDWPGVVEGMYGAWLVERNRRLGVRPVAAMTEMAAVIPLSDQGRVETMGYERTGTDEAA